MCATSCNRCLWHLMFLAGRFVDDVPSKSSSNRKQEACVSCAGFEHQQWLAPTAARSSQLRGVLHAANTIGKVG